MFAPFALLAVRLGLPGCRPRGRGGGEIVVLSQWRTEGSKGLDGIAVVEKRVVLALELTNLLRAGPDSQDLAFPGQIQGSKVERFEVDMSHSIDCYNIECPSISAFVASGVVVKVCSANSADFFRSTSALFAGTILNNISLGSLNPRPLVQVQP